MRFSGPKTTLASHASKWAIIPVVALTPGCDSSDSIDSRSSSVVAEAIKADFDGRIISNEIMEQTYPHSFRAGSPEYIERDFEAGADFICDEIEFKYGRDICAEPDINWRR